DASATDIRLIGRAAHRAEVAFASLVHPGGGAGLEIDRTQVHVKRPGDGGALLPRVDSQGSRVGFTTVVDAQPCCAGRDSGDGAVGADGGDTGVVRLILHVRNACELDARGFGVIRGG